ncbi:MAG: N-acetyltransferase [Acidobacteria bacterium]|nr:N-acetyltransferase [Acidobacteriota bacterium]
MEAGANAEKQQPISGRNKIGAGALIAPDVIVGHPSKRTLVEERDFSSGKGAVVGERCILRSGTVIYEGAVVGDNVQTAHNVIVREHVAIGDNCILGNGAVVREYSKLGNNVRMMDYVIISEAAQIGDNVFIGPNVSFTAGRHMTAALEASGAMTAEERDELEGFAYLKEPSVIVEDEVRIGANAVILAGVRLGKACVIAAGAVVSTDVPPGALFAGNPARMLKSGGP